MAQRKLQQEMDRVFKRVAEGVAAFDAIYEKVQMSSNHSQKEKLEQDLKREIKKLQRLRDQIKTWMGSNDIKDKKMLTEQRKLIETEMERFKACEKEMKTKAYSKEGLTNSMKLDPREKEKVDTSNFVSSMLEELERQIEALEAEQETLQAKKSRKDTSKQERLSEIDDALERHKWHVDKLEIILRKLENGELSPDVINNIQDDIRYYVESNQDVDFAEDEEIYDELNLDYEEDGDLENYGRDDTPSYSLDDLASEHSTSASVKETSTSLESAAPSRKSSIAANSPVLSHSNISTNVPTSNTIPSGMKPAPPPVRSTSELKYASAAASGSNNLHPALSPLPPPTPSTPVTSSHATPVTTTSQAPVASAATSTPAASHAVPSAPVAARNNQQPPGITKASSTTTSPAATNTSIPVSSNETSTPAAPAVKTEKKLKEERKVTLPPGLQDLIGSFDAARERIGAPPPIQSIAKLLESSYIHCPNSFLANKPKNYQPETPYPTPSYYPQEPLSSLDEEAMFVKMDIDTLFYIFYYRQGTYQQALAAHELKRRSWRFHKRFLTWFQRHEEPKTINNEYEQGTYRYFDFEGLWLQRRKSNFKFEYQFLEDEDLIK
ncbi:similar to Saccharomyces cerevisiae YPR072W NOT5 Subunit of the CCR4-NOT complex [Geotrichum candidum]|uniref:General negative regulator of transcription subunit n=1 Tax=Geotrichum candidum TaxID=1173061 RepID=A0A0J9X7A6_GEOCN|nr:similar to Saccharomyces cerevisiae YPR072W NOT5 Subunit of the CCR4-NOT complex [Geotrichum candidum]